MIPVTTLQGLEPDELVCRIGGRDVAVWGSGDVAQDVLASLKGAGIAVKALLHTRGGGLAYGLPVRAAAEALDGPPGAARPFVVIASMQYRLPAEAACLGYGLRKNLDFVDHLAIRRPVGVIEVAGPLRDGVAPLMSFENFRRVLEKMRRDQPQLCHVELAWLGDPLRNPELPEIVSHCERFVPCTVSTALDVSADLAAIAAAAPSRFNVVARGYGEAYGSAWNGFLAHLDGLTAAVPAACGKTRFSLKYLRLKGEPEERVARWRERLDGSGIVLAVEAPYPFPYDILLARCAGHGLAADAAAQIGSLPWNLDLACDLARRDREHPCLSQRLFPVVGADLTVGGCHLYDDATLAPAYLDVTWEDLLRLRRGSAQCSHCQEHGLHRLDLPVLARRFPEAADRLLHSQ